MAAPVSACVSRPENPLRWLGDFLLAEAQKREARGGEEVATATATASG